MGIDYEDSATEAQRVVLDAVKSLSAVLADPEPLVLVDELASSTVNLRVYFWVNAEKYSPLKVRSAVLRQVKVRLQQEGFTLPDESREIIFPRGVPVRLNNSGAVLDESAAVAVPENGHNRVKDTKSNKKNSQRTIEATSPVATAAEGGLESERREIEE